MVVDEELKMMCTVGDRGGVVVGPRLKEMAHLAHTEYELRGRSHPGRARGAARDDVRGDGHRLAGAERLPGHRAVRAAAGAATTPARWR